MTFFHMLYQLLIGPLELILETVFGIAQLFIGKPGISILVMSLVMNLLLLPLYRRADAIQAEEGEENPVERLKRVFEPEGLKVYPVSAATGEGLKTMLYGVWDILSHMSREPIVYEKEYIPEIDAGSNLPFTVEKTEEHLYTVEGPRIEKMLGYTNLDSEKGLLFFQRFLKETGILAELEALGIEEGDTVKMYGQQFDYYKC